MIITITGPRSVGKSTVSKLVAKKMKLRYVSSDEIGEKALKKHGGLDKSIKSGIIKQFIKEKGYDLIIKEYKKNNFVFDLSGGSISSSDFPKASEELRKIVNKKSIVIGLLPFIDKNKSVRFLFNREKNRAHFKEVDKTELLARTKKRYPRISKILKEFCDRIIYTQEKPSSIIAEEIINYVTDVK